jgi:hypothetical protein
MNPKLFPARMVRLISEKDRAALGIKTDDERMAKWEAKNERELQRQIVSYLRLRDIEVEWKRTDKKSTGTVGWPDITFAVKVNGFPTPCAYEVKFGSGTLSPEQNDLLQRMQAPPNCWRVRVIRTFIEVVDDMRELGL